MSGQSVCNRHLSGCACPAVKSSQRCGLYEYRRRYFPLLGISNEHVRSGRALGMEPQIVVTSAASWSGNRFPPRSSLQVFPIRNTGSSEPRLHLAWRLSFYPSRRHAVVPAYLYENRENAAFPCPEPDQALPKIQDLLALSLGLKQTGSCDFPSGFRFLIFLKIKLGISRTRALRIENNNASCSIVTRKFSFRHPGLESIEIGKDQVACQPCIVPRFPWSDRPPSEPLSVAGSF